MATPASRVAQGRSAHAQDDVATKADVRRLERRLRALEEALEDRFDAAESRRRLADPAEEPIPYAKARKTLGLD